MSSEWLFWCKHNFIILNLTITSNIQIVYTVPFNYTHVTLFLHVWQHEMFHVQNAKVIHGNKSFYEMNNGISNR